MSEQNQLVVIAQNTGLGLESAQPLINAFQPYFEQAEQWRQRVSLIKVTDVSQTREMNLARETRLALKEIRINVEHTRKKLKEDSLRKGKAIDGMANVLEFLIAPLEKSLLEQEQFAERAEAARKTARAQVRLSEIAPVIDPAVLSSLNILDMEEAAYQQLLTDSRLAHSAKQEAQARLEAENKAKAEADARERARIQEENQRLMREVAEKEEAARKEKLRLQALAEVERQKAETARKQLEIEHKRKLEETRAEERKKAETEAAVVRAQQEKAAAELRLKQEVEQALLAAARARTATEQAAAEAARSDKEKLLALAEQIRKFPLPELKSAGNRTILRTTFADLAVFIEGLD